MASSRSSRKHGHRLRRKKQKGQEEIQVDQSVIVSVKSSDLYMKITENMNMEIVLHERKRERDGGDGGGSWAGGFVVAATRPPIEMG